MSYINFNRQKRIEAEKKADKDRKTFYNAVRSKTMKNLKNRIDVRLVNNEKDYLKWKSYN